MEPEIKTGEFIIIKKYESYEVNDIVTYEEDDFLVTHRIIEKFDNSFLAKGDANNKEDEIKSDSKILGKIVFHSLSIGIFVRKYLKYTIILFMIFIIIRNIVLINSKDKTDYNEKGEK